MSIEDDAKAAVGWVENHLPGHAKAAPTGFAALPRKAQPRPSQPSAPSQPEEHHMSVILDDAAKAAAALVKHVKTLAGNPLVDTLVEVGAGLFLTPAEVTAVKAFVQTLEAGRAPATAAVQAAEDVAGAFAADGAQQAQQTVQGPAQPPQASFTPAADSAAAQAPVVR